jgi:hypothetical protein
MLKKEGLKLKTYEPEKKMAINKEEVLPNAVHYGSRLGNLWGGFQLFFSGFFLAIRTFFKAKEKIQDVQMKHSRILDLRKAKDRPKRKLSFR